MQRRELRNIKRSPKAIGAFAFKKLKKGDLPEPWKKMGGGRYRTTGLLQADDDSIVVFITRDGETRDRKRFMGFLSRRVATGLEPVFILHYHPSHKAVHALVNCESSYNYVNRQLPGAKEFSLKAPADLDPVDDSLQLVAVFCSRFGIRIKPQGEDLLQ